MKIKYNKKNKLSILGDTKRKLENFSVILKSYIGTPPEKRQK